MSVGDLPRGPSVLQGVVLNEIGLGYKCELPGKMLWGMTTSVRVGQRGSGLRGRSEGQQLHRSNAVDSKGGEEFDFVG